MTQQLPTTWDPALFNELTPMEQAFVLHPEAFTAPVKAAMEVGYSKSTAKSKAHVMRKQLMHFIAPKHEARLEKAGVATIERICDELEAIAFAREVDYYDTIDVDGETVKVLKDVTRLPEHMKRAIKSVTFTTIESMGADNKTFTYQRLTGIELHDKLSALKELAEIRGGHDPRLRKLPGETADDNELLQHLTDKELEMVEKLYTRAAQRRDKEKKAQPIQARVVKE